MNDRKTATEINIEELARIRAFTTLCCNRHLQAEAIAKHYVAHAELALEILNILKLDADMNSDTRRIIDLLVNQIKTNHLHDLGIKLEWEKPQ